MQEETQHRPFEDLDDAQVQALWDRYFPRLKASLAERVRRIRRPVANESEIALSAFNSFVRRAKAGEFPDLSDEGSFWRLLRTIAVRKANDAQKNLWADRRGGSQGTQGQADSASEDGRVGGIDTAAGKQAQPSEDLEIHELFNSLLEKLPSERHRDAILLKLQGADTETISECLSTTNRTVQRMLKTIREDWEAQTKLGAK
jgi:DNA-directed RNA polymerase specialized sigma24 family protein